VQKSVPIVYDELFFDEGYRADLIVEQSVLLELKSIEALLPVHAKQVISASQTCVLVIFLILVKPSLRRASND
jgi:GxxExxY protein